MALFIQIIARNCILRVAPQGLFFIEVVPCKTVFNLEQLLGVLACGVRNINPLEAPETYWQSLPAEQLPAIGWHYSNLDHIR